MILEYRLLNVFTDPDADDPSFTGNPLCVFVDGSGLITGPMQALARQFNLSETSFVLPVADADAGAEVDAAVRIFTPNYELPFAGHPTLGTAQVVAGLRGGVDRVVLRMAAGDIPVTGGQHRHGSSGGVWTLTAGRPTSTPGPDPAHLAAALGLPADAIASDPSWVDTGVPQLIVPLRSVQDVRSVAVDPALLLTRAAVPDLPGEAMAYVWAPTSRTEIEARMFFTQHGSVLEDPATGSACANLGGWLQIHGTAEGRWAVHQGAAVHRPSVLQLALQDGRITVGGAVRELGAGTVEI